MALAAPLASSESIPVGGTFRAVASLKVRMGDDPALWYRSGGLAILTPLGLRTIENGARSVGAQVNRTLADRGEDARVSLTSVALETNSGVILPGGGASGGYMVEFVVIVRGEVIRNVAPLLVAVLVVAIGLAVAHVVDHFAGTEIVSTEIEAFQAFVQTLTGGVDELADAGGKLLSPVVVAVLGGLALYFLVGKG